MRKGIIIITILALLASFMVIGVVAYIDSTSTPVDTSSSSGTNQ